MNWFSLSYKNIYRNKRRSFLTMLSIGAVAFVMMFQHTIVRGMQEDLTNNIKDLQTGDFFIENKDLTKYQMFNPLSLLVDPAVIRPLLEKYKGVSISENLNFATSLYQDGTMYFTKGMAFSMAKQEEALKAGHSIFKLYQNEGHLPTGDSEVAVALNLSQKNHIKVGDRISVLTQTASHNLNGASFTVTAIVYFSVEAYNGDTLLFDIPAAQKLLRTSEVMRILVDTGGDDKLSAKIISELTPKISKDYVAKIWYDSPEASILKVQNTVMLIVNLVFFVIGGSIIVNTSIMNILERRREIGMMGALGTRVGEIRFLFFLESIWLGTIGTLLGIFLSCIIAAILNHTGWDLLGAAVSKTSGLTVSSTLYPQIVLKDVVSVFLFGFLISAVISYIPTGRIAKITPAEAFRS